MLKNMGNPLREKIRKVVLDAAGQVFERSVEDGDDFFELGGDSVLAIELIVKIEQELEIEMDAAFLFSAETFDGLIDSIDASINSQPTEA